MYEVDSFPHLGFSVDCIFAVLVTRIGYRLLESSEEKVTLLTDPGREEARIRIS